MATKFKLKEKKSNGFSMDNVNKFFMKAKLAMYMKKGLDIKDAAKLCGVSDHILGLLRSDPEFEEFIDYCHVSCEHNHLENIKAAGDSGQWQASSWILERKFPEKYGKKDTIRHEYEIKLMTFQKVILGIINQLDPLIRHQIMQKLRSVNIENEVYEIQMDESNLIPVFGET